MTPALLDTGLTVPEIVAALEYEPRKLMKSTKRTPGTSRELCAGLTSKTRSPRLGVDGTFCRGAETEFDNNAF